MPQPDEVMHQRRRLIDRIRESEMVPTLVDEPRDTRPGLRACEQRGKRPGILLPQVDVDLCYPADRKARPALIAEVKEEETTPAPVGAGDYD